MDMGIEEELELGWKSLWCGKGGGSAKVKEISCQI